MALNTFYVINEADRANVNFEEIVQQPDKVRANLAGTQFIIKSKIGADTPTFITNGTVITVATLTHSECLALLEGAAGSEEIA